MDLKFVDANFIPYVPNEFLSFDDVQLIPNFSTVETRKDPKISTSTQLTPLIKIPTPIISAPMDCVTEADMALAMIKAGGFGILHRFYAGKYGAEEGKKRWVNDVNRLIKEAGTVGISIGAFPDDVDLVKEVLDMGSPGVVVCVDVAHGHLKKALEQITRVKDKFGQYVQVISGSICTPAAANDCITAGAAALRVGVGPGSVCTTRLQTGCGLPQLTAILNIRRTIFARKTNVTLIADGGIRNSGDIVKALAAGADSVMIGRLLAGANESSAEYLSTNGKKYRGQASIEFMSDMNIDRGGSEGESTWIHPTGPVSKTIAQLVDGIKSGMSYCGIYNLEDLANETRFVKITQHGYQEGLPKV